MSVFLAIPNRGAIQEPTVGALFRTGRTDVLVRTRSTSLLTFTFNILWTDALNERKALGLKRFVMMHDDIAPLDEGWLDTLLREFDASGADVLSAVVPIKDERGLSSIALWNPETREMVRVTMTEALAYPKTFGGTEAGRPGWAVLPNTGLWVCDFTKPWVEKVCFTIRDRNFYDAHDGMWKAQCYSEDWDFGAQCHALGLSVKATTAVKLNHHGQFKFPNFVAWGTHATDDQVNYWRPPGRAYQTSEVS